MDTNIELEYAFIALAVALICVVVSSIAGLVRYVGYYREKKWNLAQEQHLAEVQSHAEAEDLCITAVAEVERKLYHYRHNIHCLWCGRFARQAEGYPPGVADCRYHPITIRTSEDTGAIPVIVYETPAWAIPEAPQLELEPPTPVPRTVIDHIVQGSDETQWEHEPLEEIIIWPEELEQLELEHS